MDHREKLLQLLETTSLRKYSEPGTWEEAMEMGRYYSDMFDRVAARGELHAERVRGEMARLLAEAIQPMGRERYGVADAAAIRQLLVETWNSDVRDSWGRQMSLMKTAASQTALSQGQQAAFMELMESFPDTFLDLVSSEVARLKLVPLENVGEVSLAVADMMKEDAHADQSSGN